MRVVGRRRRGCRASFRAGGCYEQPHTPGEGLLPSGVAPVSRLARGDTGPLDRGGDETFDAAARL